MKKRTFGIGLAAAFLLVAASAPARAGFYIGVRGGLSNQSVSQTASLGKIDFDKNSAFLYGGQVGIKLLALAVEGEIYRADHSLVTDSSSFPSGVDLNYYYLGINGKLGIPLAVFYPYITVGYGKYSADLKTIGKSSDTAFNIGAGAGLSLGKVSLFAEARYTDFSFDINSLKWDFGGLDLHFGLNIHL
jgi:hypothetical protein